MDGAQLLILNGLAQSNVDMNGFQLLNLDTSNLGLTSIPPSVNCPPSNWLRGWDASAGLWSFSQPVFNDIAGLLTPSQMGHITSVGVLRVGIWNATPISAPFLPTLDLISPPANNLSLNSRRIINLQDPVSPQDAVTLHYMDGLLEGLQPKQAVRCASTTHVQGHIVIGFPTIDGVTPLEGDRVLLKNQSFSVDNGIWIAHSGAWTRATDCNIGALITDAYCFVLQGTINAASSWVQANVVSDITTDPQNWVIFSSQISLTAGNGINITSGVISAVGTAGVISVGPGGITIANSYIGQASITTLGTITTGTWNGDVIDPTVGGTGVRNTFNISLAGDLTTAAAPAIGGPLPVVFLAQGATSVTLPVTGTLATLAGAETFTNKRIARRTVTTATSTVPTFSTDLTDLYMITALAGDITSMTFGVTGTPTLGQTLIMWIRDDGNARNITWGTLWAASTDLPLPLVTTPGKFLRMTFEYNTTLVKWVLTGKLNNI